MVGSGDVKEWEKLTCQTRGNVLMSVTISAMMVSFQANVKRRKDRKYMAMSDGRNWWPMMRCELEQSQYYFGDTPRAGLDHSKR